MSSTLYDCRRVGREAEPQGLQDSDPYSSTLGFLREATAPGKVFGLILVIFKTKITEHGYAKGLFSSLQ